MRHAVKGRKLNVTSKHRKAMFANLTTALFIHEQISTTLPKAKDLRSYAEKMITLGKQGDLAAFRKAQAFIQDKETTRKLFDVLAKRYEKRNGGYVRVLKAGYRYGDMAPMAIVELVDRDVNAKGKADKARHEAMKKAVAESSKSEKTETKKVAKEEKADMKKSKVSKATSATKVERVQRNEKSK
jgi:large subunit ribosomal protein L17